VKAKLLFFIFIISIIYFFYASISFIKISATTYDEGVHLSSGYSYIETGRYLMNIYDHPPLAKILAAIPLKFMKLNSFISHKYFQYLMQYNYGDLFLYNNTQDAEKILNTSRYFLLSFWGISFIFLFYLYSSTLDKNISLYSLILFSTNPIFISNIPLVTTDIAPTFFYTFTYLVGWWLSSDLKFKNKILNSNYNLSIIAGILSGLAMTSKYSMFILPPFFVVLLIFNNFFTNKFKNKELIKIIVIYLLTSIIVLAMVFKGNITLYSNALFETFKRLDKGRSSFIMGHYSIEGVWWYFPVAFFLKNSIFLFLFFIIGLFFTIKDWKKYIWLIFPFLFYFLASLNSKVQIGIRHLLPLMPFVIIISAIAIDKIIKKYSLKSLFFIIPFFIFSIVHLLKVHPFYLSYFNEIIGHSNGYKYLTDSNIDWGQDIKSLSNYLKENGNPPIIISYFGVANPDYYKLNYVSLWTITNVDFPLKNIDLCSAKKILFAISITNLQATYYRDKTVFNWLKNKEPIYKAGYSIFLYDITNDKESLLKLAKIFEASNMLNYSNCIRRLIK